MGWDRTGEKVSGEYVETFPFTGVVMSSRVKYAGAIQHTVKLDAPMIVFGRITGIILVDNKDIA